MTSDRVCAWRGLLVDGDTRVLTDPCEYFHPSTWIEAGCGRLKCSACGSTVRFGLPGRGLKLGDDDHDVKALYAAADWATVPFVVDRYPLVRRMRLYACACTMWEAKQVDRIDNDHEMDSDPNVPWYCTGHPAPEFPIALADFTIEAGTTGAELVAKILGGSCPRPLNRKDALGPEPGVWLAWLYVYLQGLPLADQISIAIADQLQSPDPQTRGRVLFFFMQFPHAAGIEKVVTLAESELRTIALGYPIPELRDAPTLWAVLASRVASPTNERDTLDERVASVIKRVLVEPSLPHDDVGPTSSFEFERQRRLLQGQNPETLEWLMKDFARATQRERGDVVGVAFERHSDAFDEEMRVFIADHILEIDAAAPGRWRDAMWLLTDWRHKPEQGHLVVIAGARLVQAGRLTLDEFRAWVQARRESSGWVVDAWVVPIEDMLQQRN